MLFLVELGPNDFCRLNTVETFSSVKFLSVEKISWSNSNELFFLDRKKIEMFSSIKLSRSVFP